MTRTSLPPKIWTLESRETLTEDQPDQPHLSKTRSRTTSPPEATPSLRSIDNNLGGEDAQDVMRLLLIASLATVPNAVKGLAVPEIVAYLCAPGRDLVSPSEAMSSPV